MEETQNQTNNNPDKPYNLDSNIEAMLAYLPFIGIFTSVAIFFTEKNDKFVRFNAMQGMLLGLTYIVSSMALGLTIILGFVIPMLNLAAFAIWIYMMWKTYNKEEVELPIIGKIARDQLNKSTK